MPHKIIAGFIFISLLCVIAAAIYASSFSQKYYSKACYEPDPLYGFLSNETAYYNVQEHGRIKTFFKVLDENPRMPFTIMPLVLFAPSFLRHINAHFFIELPFLFLFLFLLAYCTWLRTKNFLYASTLIVFYITSYAISEPYFGIGFNLPDAMAGYSAAVAALSLLIWSEKKNKGWLILFAVCLSLSVLTRYIFSVYTFLLFSVPLFFVLKMHYKESKNLKKSVLIPLMQISILVIVISGYFIVRHFKSNFDYYSYWQSSNTGTMNINIAESALSFAYIFGGFLRKIHAILLILLLISGFYFFHPEKNLFRKRLLLSAWLCLILPFYWIVILKTNGRIVSSAFLAAFPIIFASIALPLHDKIIESRKKLFSFFLIIVLTASFIDLGITIRKNNDYLQSDFTESAERKIFSVKISQLINNVSPRDCTLSLVVFGEHFLTEGISLESFYTNGRYINPLNGINTYSSYGQFWEQKYHGSNITKITESVHNKIERSINLVLAYTDSSNSEHAGYDNLISGQVASGVIEKLSLDSTWKKMIIPNTGIGLYNLYYKNYLSFGKN